MMLVLAFEIHLDMYQGSGTLAPGLVAMRSVRV